VLDAGQCNDSYSLAVIALKLKEVFGLEDINDLPVSYDIAWYEQKAVAVLLALLALGVNGIRLGPTLPAFLSANVISVLVDKFDIKLIGDAKEDVEAMVREMFLSGVSTRQIGPIVWRLTGSGMSASTVGRIVRQLDAKVAEYKSQPVADEYVYVLSSAIAAL